MSLHLPGAPSRHRKSRWLPGHSVRLLENGEAFFPAVFDAIRSAQHEVILETFIVFEDKVGLELRDALIEAASRGVRVDVMVDGFGSSDLTDDYLDRLAAVGVHVRSFDPGFRIFGQRVNVLRRMHRKIVVVDGERAFVGGINYSADHLADFGPQAKQDYSVEVRGPLVDEIRHFALSAIRSGDELRPSRTPRSAVRPAPARTNVAMQGGVEAMFVTRDNIEHRNDIERHYRMAIRSARKSVLIANAYFFPGYRLLNELRRAARRGVDVTLVLQGEPDVPLARKAASLLYEHLQRDGIKIHEYCARPLHGKVAVIDDEWATVGSSNLDPLSLSLNLEANVMLRDAAFATQLRQRLDHLIAHSCTEVTVPPPLPGWNPWPQMLAFFTFHFLRRFPAWANWLPRHAPRLQLLKAVAQRARRPERGAAVHADGRQPQGHAR